MPTLPKFIARAECALPHHPGLVAQIKSTKIDPDLDDEISIALDAYFCGSPDGRDMTAAVFVALDLDFLRNFASTAGITWGTMKQLLGYRIAMMAEDKYGPENVFSYCDASGKPDSEAADYCNFPELEDQGGMVGVHNWNRHAIHWPGARRYMKEKKRLARQAKQAAEGNSPAAANSPVAGVSPAASVDSPAAGGN